MGIEFEVGTEFGVGTKIEKYGIVNAEINVAVNNFSS